MDISSPFPGQHHRRLAALALAASAVLLWCPPQVLASSMSGSPGTVKLNGGSVSPTTGTTSTVFTFRVTYTNRANLAPSTISVVIDGVAHTMVRTVSDTDYRDGALFSYSTKLPARWHLYYFSGKDVKGRQNLAPGGVFRVRSTTASSGGGTTSPTSRPSAGSGSGSSPGSTVTRPSTSTTGGSGSGSGGPGTSSGSNSQTTWTAAASASGHGSLAAGALGAVVGSGAVVVIGDGLWPDAAPTGAMFAGQSAVNFAPAPRSASVVPPAPRIGGLEFGDAPLPMYGSDGWARAMVQTLAISTSTSVTLAMAMLFFARRRRIEDDARARENERGPAPLLDEMTLASYLYGPQRAAAMAAEMTLPRWRRPSLTAARTREGPGQAVLAAERLRFDRGEIAFGDGREFRRIRYRMVRLSDRPDEILGYELGRLDEGDEIEVLERSGFYVKIRTPYGLEGWVHRTTIGAPVSAEADRRADSAADGTMGYVSREDSLVGRLIRERSAV